MNDPVQSVFDSDVHHHLGAPQAATTFDAVEVAHLSDQAFQNFHHKVALLINNILHAEEVPLAQPIKPAPHERVCHIWLTIDKLTSGCTVTGTPLPQGQLWVNSRLEALDWLPKMQSTFPQPWMAWLCLGPCHGEWPEGENHCCPAPIHVQVHCCWPHSWPHACPATGCFNWFTA